MARPAAIPSARTHEPATAVGRFLLTQLLVAMRPKQWAKNVFVLAALVFSGHLLDPGYVQRVVAAFMAFCVLSGVVYLFNDIRDCESDRQHPEKRHRPIASGRLGIKTAGFGAGVLGIGVLGFGFWLGTGFGSVLAIYGILNLAYSLGLKHVVILDVMIIAAGFLLRAIGGAVAIEVAISSWFVLCTMLLALFLGFVKRRQELALLKETAANHRRNLKDYNLPFLDQMIAVVTAGTLVSYALYSMSPEVAERVGGPYFSLTIPFVMYGLLRYLYLVYKKGEGGNPTSAVLEDRPLLVSAGLWLAALSVILYL